MKRSKNKKPQMNTDKNKNKLNTENTEATERKISAVSACSAVKPDIDQIVEDFTDKLIKEEKITVDDVLKKYPKYADQLKPLLESTVLLLQAGDEIREKTDAEFAKFDQEIWQELEQNILAKSVKAVEKQKAQIKRKEAVPLHKRFEYILLMLYVKGYQCRINESIKGITRFIKTLFLLEKETELSKLVKVYYDFVPYKLGPFDPAIYQDLKVLEMAGIIKRTTYMFKKPVTTDQPTDEEFQMIDESAMYTLTEDGIKYAKALANWLDKKDPTILQDMRRIKTKYGSAAIKKLLKYIYENYPEYTKESEVIETILKRH